MIYINGKSMLEIQPEESVSDVPDSDVTDLGQLPSP